MDAALCAFDADGVVTHWNREAERILGWSAAEAVGRASEAVIASAILQSLGGAAGRGRGRAKVASDADLTARARRYLEEKTHGHPGPRTDV